MSYDTTVNDAIDPPAARLGERQSALPLARWWLLAAAIATGCGAALAAIAVALEQLRE